MFEVNEISSDSSRLDSGFIHHKPNLIQKKTLICILLLLAMALSLLPSCYTQRQCKEKFCLLQQSSTDSSSQRSISSQSSRYVIQKLNYLPPAAINTTITPCDSNGRIRPGFALKNKSGNATLQVSEQSGALKVDCTCDSLEQAFSLIYTSQHYQIDSLQSVINKNLQQQTTGRDWTTIILLILFSLAFLFIILKILKYV
jgi:hypothetical protein